MLPGLSFTRACKAYSNTAGIVFNASTAVMQQQRLTHSRSVPVLSDLLRRDACVRGDVPCSSQTAALGPARLLGSPNSSALPGQQSAGEQTFNSNRAHRAWGCVGHNSSIASRSWGYTSGSGSSFHWYGLQQKRMLSTSGGDTSREASTHRKPSEALPGSKVNSHASSSSSSNSGEPKVQVPLAVAAGAAAAGEAVSKAAKAAAKQVGLGPTCCCDTPGSGSDSSFCSLGRATTKST